MRTLHIGINATVKVDVNATITVADDATPQQIADAASVAFNEIHGKWQHIIDLNCEAFGFDIIDEEFPDEPIPAPHGL